MRFNYSSIITDRTSATEDFPTDLPTRPISHLIVTLDGYNVTDENTLAELLVFINSIHVENLGNTIFSMESEDAYAQNCYLFGNRPVLTGKIATDNLNRSLSLIIPFGRRMFDEKECLPGFKKGELTLHMDMTELATTWDNGILNVNCVELPDANPSQYLKSIVNTISAPGQTGDNKVDLPIGNDIVAVALRMTSWYAAAASTLGIESIKLMVDESENMFSYAKSQCLIGQNINLFDTMHGAIAAQGLMQPASTMFVDFDPTKDGKFLLKTAGKSSVKLVLNMGVDEATQIATYELVKI
jgi:hypothetical protein